ncbi:ABC transporter permease [Nesterenkonia haasae]|uniref:ABC transporter permease n=1 Tax=Nesterenkonia haasae TaxID=2587813 RepID=UPI0013912C62|nr:ABC transporter permease [Nesterenkonia haasae]
MKAVLIHYGKLLGSSFLLLLVVITILFALLEAAPGDPVQSLVGDAPVSEQFREQLVAAYGLDRSVVERYFIYMGSVLTGDLGTSFTTQTPVLDRILGRLGNTLALAIPATVISTLGGIILGVIAARTRNPLLDTGISGGAVGMFSIPNFWLGLMLIAIFSVQLGWLPAQGTASYGQSGIALEHMVLPLITLVTSQFAYNIRVMRSSMIESLGQDFVDTARSKGLSYRQIVWRHGMPNAMLPMITITGYGVGLILAGSVLVERVFGWPGMGLLLVESINNNDTLVVLGVAIVITVCILIANILTDIVYGLADPRLRARFRPKGSES